MITTTHDMTSHREDFPMLANPGGDVPLVYLDNAATTHKPQAVLDRVMEFYCTYNSNVHRGAYSLSEQASDAYESARETLRAFIQARKGSEIVFTHGTTHAINLLACSLGPGVCAGDEIVVTEMEHHSNLVPWQILCQQKGARLRFIPINDDGSLRMESVKELLGPRTKLLAVSHVSNVLGTINPIRKLVSAAHALDIPVLVDAAQSVQHIPLNVQELDCDFLVFSGHKMYAGTGIGVLYGKEKWLQKLQPSYYGGGMVGSVDWNTTTFAETPFKFEAGTPNIAGALSLDAAIKYLESVGRNRITEHEHDLMRYAMEALSDMKGIRIYGTTTDKCGCLSFNVEGTSAYDVTMILDKLGVAVRSGTHCAEPVMRHYGVSGAIRASFALYNTIDEIDVLTSAVQRAQQMLS